MSKAAQLEADLRRYLAQRAAHLDISTVKAALVRIITTPVPRRNMVSGPSHSVTPES